ncbi:MAG: hypothetical protein AMJ93_08090 [Anaerolineae bacterium SM23_84]|nr:MAG: hypothetical protein AMJ93_08090 [Anaerolineae bacterium SM23_84]
MEITIEYRPSYSLAIAKLEPQEEINVEAGSMVAMSEGLALETRAAGGLLASLKRSILGGESFFMNTYRAPASGGEIMLAPPLPGDIAVLELRGEAVLVQSGAYVASSQGIHVDTKFGGAKTFFASEGLFLLRCQGTGTLIVSSYGAVHHRDLSPAESFTVDTGHLVAFPEGVDFKVRAVGGLKSTLFSGEGLVVDLSGTGKVWMQTRSSDAFLTWLMPQVQRRLPKQGR